MSEKMISDLHRRYKQGGINRRAFLQAASALGVASAFPLSQANRLLAAEPKRGGHFRVGVSNGSTGDTLDPATFNNGQLRQTAGSVCNYLQEISASGEPVPELAESIEPNADATAFRVKLRNGVEFHNGKPFGPEDVIASYNHHRGEDSASAIRAIVEQIEDIAADGSDVVVFTLKSPNADFPAIMTDYHLPIYASEDGKIDVTSMVGTGGYVLKEWEPGVRATFERNPNYWRDDRAHFDSAETLIITDVVARTNALMTGEIDAMDRVDLSTIHLLSRRDDIKILEVVGTQYYSMPMFANVEPFTDNNVRLAVKLAIDRQAIVTSILRGYGIPGNDNPITPAYQYFNPELEQREYDPDRAKHLLRQAGHEGLELELSVSDAPYVGAVDSAALFREQAALAGITVNIRREPADGYWNDVWRKKPFMVGYMGGRATADWMFSSNFAADSPWNDANWKHERFNMLLREARAELDDNKRREMYFEMQRIVRDEGSTMVYALPSIVDGVSDKVQHGELAGNWPLDGDRCIERWWFA